MKEFSEVAKGNISNAELLKAKLVTITCIQCDCTIRDDLVIVDYLFENSHHFSLIFNMLISSYS